MAKKKQDVTVNYKGKEHVIDLYWQIDSTLLEKDYRWNLYINIALVREIARTLWWTIDYIDTTITPLSTTPGKEQLHTSADVSVSIPDWEATHTYRGKADDIYALSSLSRSCFPNMARVQALAVKNALKRKYPFFEADYLDIEAMGERWIISAETKEELQADWWEKYNDIRKSLINSKSLAELRTASLAIKESHDKWELDATEYVWLKKIFMTENTKHSK